MKPPLVHKKEIQFSQDSTYLRISTCEKARFEGMRQAGSISYHNVIKVPLNQNLAFSINVLWDFSFELNPKAQLLNCLNTSLLYTAHISALKYTNIHAVKLDSQTQHIVA